MNTINTITTVSTKDELKYAIKNKFAKIICTGDIAEKVNRSVLILHTSFIIKKSSRTISVL